MEYLYVIREREFVKTNENVYKVGKTKQAPNKRMVGYPTGSELYLTACVDDCDVRERELIDYCKNNFTHRKEIGAEYFQGDVKAIMKHIFELSESWNPDGVVESSVSISYIENINDSWDELRDMLISSELYRRNKNILCDLHILKKDVWIEDLVGLIGIFEDEYNLIDSSNAESMYNLALTFHSLNTKIKNLALSGKADLAEFEKLKLRFANYRKLYEKVDIKTFYSENVYAFKRVAIAKFLKEFDLNIEDYTLSNDQLDTLYIQIRNVGIDFPQYATFKDTNGFHFHYDDLEFYVTGLNREALKKRLETGNLEGIIKYFSHYKLPITILTKSGNGALSRAFNQKQKYCKMVKDFKLNVEADLNGLEPLKRGDKSFRDAALTILYANCIAEGMYARVEKNNLYILARDKSTEVNDLYLIHYVVDGENYVFKNRIKASRPHPNESYL